MHMLVWMKLPITPTLNASPSFAMKETTSKILMTLPKLSCATYRS